MVYTMLMGKKNGSRNMEVSMQKIVRGMGKTIGNNRCALPTHDLDKVP
jgi:hypothetical protein